MATKVNVTSIQAIEDFRAFLLLYLSKARPALEEVSAEIGRTRVWLQSTQRIHWEGILKRRARDLEEAKAKLFNAKLSLLQQKSSAEQLAYTKTKQAYDAAEDKLRIIRRWDRDFDNRVEPPARQLEKSHTILADDMTKALHLLTETVKALDDYARMAAPSIVSDLPAGPKTDAEIPLDGAASEPKKS
jgi:hypothetical protein